MEFPLQAPQRHVSEVSLYLFSHTLTFEQWLVVSDDTTMLCLFSANKVGWDNINVLQIRSFSLLFEVQGES